MQFNIYIQSKNWSSKNLPSANLDKNTSQQYLLTLPWHQTLETDPVSPKLFYQKTNSILSTVPLFLLGQPYQTVPCVVDPVCLCFPLRRFHLAVFSLQCGCWRELLVHCREELQTFVPGETESLPLTGEHKLYSSQIQKPFPEARSNQSNYHTNANTVKKQLCAHCNQNFL